MDIRVKSPRVLLAFFCAFIFTSAVCGYTAFASQSDGVITLRAEDADLTLTADIVLEPDEPPYNLGGWLPYDWIPFGFEPEKSGWYEVIFNYSKAEDTGAEAGIEIIPYDANGVFDFEGITVSLPATGPDWSVYEEYSAGYVYLEETAVELYLFAVDTNAEDYLINLREITLRLTDEADITETPDITEPAPDAEESASDAAEPTQDAGPFEPSVRVIDEADIFTNAEEAELNGELNRISAATGTHFIIMTAGGTISTPHVNYSEDFYHGNIRGKGGVYGCVMFSVFPSDRQTRIDGYGEIGSMIDGSEWVDIHERLNTFLADNDDYAGAARSFAADSFNLVSERLAEYNVDVPDADPSVQLYDYAGILSEAEFDGLYGEIHELSEKLQTDYVIVICEEDADSDYLKHYANSFYKKNFAAAGKDNVYMMAVSPESDEVLIVPFGEKFVPSYDLEVLYNGVSPKMNARGAYAACQYFLFKEGEQREYDSMEIPVIKSNDTVFDCADVLTDEQEARMLDYLASATEDRGINFNLVTIPYWSDRLASRYAEIFMSENGDSMRSMYEDRILVVLSAPPEIAGERFYANVLFQGDKANDKIGYSHILDMEFAAEASLQDSADYFAAAEIYVEGVSAALSAVIPKAVMSEMFPFILRYGLLFGFGLPALVIIILLITHRAGMKRKLSAVSYLSGESLALTESTDDFVSTHTSQTRRSSSSGSGGGGGAHSSSSSSGSGSQSGY